MASPCLCDILALPAFAKAEVLSGQTRLCEPVTWVHVSELMDAWRFLSGGEVLVSTGLELARATPDAREAYLRSLVDAGAQALVLELVQWLSEVPDEMLRAARLMDFPLVVFREEVRFAELTKEAHELILRPHRPSEPEHWLDGLLDALAETGRSSHFLEEQLGPLLALPGRPPGDPAGHTRSSVRFPVQRGRDGPAPGSPAAERLLPTGAAGWASGRSRRSPPAYRNHRRPGVAQAGTGVLTLCPLIMRVPHDYHVSSQSGGWYG